MCARARAVKTEKRRGGLFTTPSRQPPFLFLFYYPFRFSPAAETRETHQSTTETASRGRRARDRERERRKHSKRGARVFNVRPRSDDASTTAAADPSSPPIDRRRRRLDRDPSKPSIYATPPRAHTVPAHVNARRLPADRVSLSVCPTRLATNEILPPTFVYDGSVCLRRTRDGSVRLHGSRQLEELGQVECNIAINCLVEAYVIHPGISVNATVSER